MLPKYGESFKRMNVPNVRGKLRDEEIESAQIYCVLVMKRVGREEEMGLEETQGKLPREISEADIVNLLKLRV